MQTAVVEEGFDDRLRAEGAHHEQSDEAEKYQFYNQVGNANVVFPCNFLKFVHVAGDNMALFPDLVSELAGVSGDKVLLPVFDAQRRAVFGVNVLRNWIPEDRLVVHLPDQEMYVRLVFIRLVVASIVGFLILQPQALLAKDAVDKVLLANKVLWVETSDLKVEIRRCPQNGWY